MEKQIREIIAQHVGGTYEAKQKCAEEILRLFSVVGRSEQLKCDCCNGTGMVEGDYRDELESCLTCNGRGTF